MVGVDKDVVTLILPEMAAYIYIFSATLAINSSQS
jgi:hypothetical protein